MAKQQPRLMRGGLSGRVFVVTRYKDLGDGLIESLEKFDVTEDFSQVCYEINGGQDKREVADG